MSTSTTMQQDYSADIYVAPLAIRKFAVGDTAASQQHAPAASPIDLPVQSRFQNYLRAAYPFQPTSSASPSTVTLPLNSGDIILIHSVHTNGWADGTLLDTGERGWLPTNYCETYDYAAMRPLLRALTEFWDIMRSNAPSTVAIFQSKDYMRGLVAGVRYLLEKCDCLTRDSPNVRKHDGIRRMRKGLLADLSLLVKAGKHFQSLSPEKEAMIDVCLDDLLRQAFKIVTRAVKFFDIWTEEISFSRSLSGLVDLGPDATKLASSSLVTANRRSYLANSSVEQPISRPTNKRNSTTHRLSYASKADRRHLASDRLNQSYDAFLGVLASFLGSHMQSRSSGELLLTTQQAIKSCRQLLSVVELVIERYQSLSEILTESKDAMYLAITELVLSARQVFDPLHSQDDELAYLPDEHRRLVQAATNCVSGAGRCVARTRSVLEDAGDFELDSAQLERVSAPSSKQQSPIEATFSETTFTQGLQIIGIPASPATTTSNQQLPWLNIPREEDRTRGESPSTINSSVPPTPADEQPIATLLTSSNSQTTLHSPNQVDRPSSNEFAIPVGHLRHKSLLRSNNQAPTSESASDRSHTISDPSDISTASTAVTSFQGSDFTRSQSQESLLKTSMPEDEGEAAVLEKTYAHEVMYRDGQLVGGTLNALVEKLTSHDCTPDAAFVSTFYLTFRLFAKPADFVAALVWRFRYAGESAQLAGPVRLRVFNALKGWMECHWRHECDEYVLPAIIAFAREDLATTLAAAFKRILELADIVASTHAPAVPRVQSAMGKTSTSIASYINPTTPMPNPVISKSQLTALRTWKMGGAGVSILDFDPLELARQITLKFSQLFCSVLPEELLATEWMKTSGSLAVNVRALSTLFNDMANLVSESILQQEDAKKRAVLIKQWIKVANKCLELHNYQGLFAIMCSLQSTNIQRMRKTWDLVSQKNKNIVEELKKVVNHDRNHAAFRERLQNLNPPCIPYVGMFLTDLMMADHGNANTRQLNAAGGAIKVINFNKHMQTAKIISGLQRFQIPYRFQEISELQTWMQDQLIRVRSDGEQNYQNHYRRSLILEPREPHKISPNPEASSTREKFDLLAWTHLGGLSKQKSVQQAVVAQ